MVTILVFQTVSCPEGQKIQKNDPFENGTQGGQYELICDIFWRFAPETLLERKMSSSGSLIFWFY